MKIIKILLLILRIFVLLSTFVLYNYKTRSKTRARPTKKETLIKKTFVKSFDEKIVKSENLKDYVENKNFLRILKEKNALDKPALFDDLNITVISNEFWEKIVDFALNFDDKDKVEFIKEMLSFTPKERQEIIDGMLKFRESNSENVYQQEHL